MSQPEPRPGALTTARPQIPVAHRAGIQRRLARRALLATLGASALLAACARGSENTSDNRTAVPASPAPSGPGILNPPRTARPVASGALSRQRAEGFLRRFTLQSGELPVSLEQINAGFKDMVELAGAEQDAPAARRRLEGWDVVLGYDATFGATRNAQPGATGGQVRGARQEAFLFQAPAGATGYLAYLSGQLNALVQAPNSTRVITQKVETIDDLQLGEEVLVRRASGPSIEVPGVEAVAWTVAVRRGAAAFLLTVAGTGAATDRLARDLAQRLDERLAAALAAGGP